MPYPYSAGDLAAISRCLTFYNGSDYDASLNPGGMAADGHRVNFEPSLQDVATIASAVASAAEFVDGRADDAAADAVTAASQAAALTGTSSTSVAIGTGSKSFTTEADKQWPVGTHLKIWSLADPSNYMTGPVASYSGTALGVTVEAIGGSGTFTDWVIGVSGTPGADGGTGATGSQGLSPALGWNFLTATTDSDPGSGSFKFNNSDITLATFVYLDNNERNGQSVTAWLDALSTSTNTAHLGTLFFGQVSNSALFAKFRITGAVVDGTGYRKVPIVFLTGPGGFTAGSHVAVRETRTGNKGVDGAGAGNAIVSGVFADEVPVVADGSSGVDFKPDPRGVPLADVAFTADYGDLSNAPIVYTKGSDIAAAATLNLGASLGDLVDVTGNTGITAITLAEGREMTVRFTGTPQITHGASLVLPGAANMTMAAGDVAVFRGYAAGVVRMVNWQRASHATLFNEIKQAATTGATGVVELATTAEALALADTTRPITPEGARTILGGLTNLIGGLTLSNNSGTPTTTLDIAAGFAVSDDAVEFMKIGAFSKTHGAWAVGTGNGALDTGTVASNTWYHVFLIKRLDTGVVDVLFSLSATSPTMPANYTKKRRIGSFATQLASTNIRLFVQVGNTFLWTANTQSANPTVTATSQLITLVVPSGLKVFAIIRGSVHNAAAGRQVLITSPDETDVALNSPSGNLTMGTNAGNTYGLGLLRVLTDTSSRVRVIGSAAIDNVFVFTAGWEEP